MNIRITKPVEGGIIRAVVSKSDAHRLLVCAAFANCETFIACSEHSEDILTTARCLESLGAVVKYEWDGFLVTPINRHSGIQNRKRYKLDCGESGATLRFLLPICGALGLSVSFQMGGLLPERPLSTLYNEMVSHGYTLSEQGSSPLSCEEQLKNGIYTLPGSISSQYISGLLFALPLLSGDSLVHVTGAMESRPYVDMTLDALRFFGVTILEEEGQVFRIPGGQIGNSPKNIEVNGDWSNSAFWLSAGAIGKNSITCAGLNMDSQQGDRVIVDLLARFGAHVVCGKDTVTVSPRTLRGIYVDSRDISDLIPVLAAVASVTEGVTTIRNVDRQRFKESGRLKAIAESQSSLGANITETEDGLVIVGKKMLKGGVVQSFGDHRIAMAAAILSAVCTGSVLIKNAEAINKSYPHFFVDFITVLGGEIDTED
jgi:3-phosphoshikimate 1-carboxyvinyltransferase